MKPLNGYVLIKQNKKEETTASGILLAETTRTYQDQGTIHAVSKDNTNKLKVGDTVLFDKFATNEFKHEGETYLSIHQDSLIAIL